MSARANERDWGVDHCVVDWPGCTWSEDLVRVRMLPIGPLFKCVSCIVQELVWTVDPLDNGGDPLRELR